MKEISLKELLEAGCHFGHQTTRWNPKMKPYIFTARDGVHIFDLIKTKEGLETASAFAKATASQNGQVLFIGTKRQAQDINQEAAKRVSMPYLSRKWIGGLITNWDQVGKRISHLKTLKSDKETGKYKEWTKKENLMIDKEIGKLEAEFGPLAELKSVPAAIFVLDAKKDLSAIKEAKIRKIPVIAIVDTNTNPDDVDYPIPANDDAVKSIQLIVGYIADSIAEGLDQLKVNESKIEMEKKKVGNEVKSEVKEESKLEKKEVKRKAVKKEKVEKEKNETNS